MSQVWQARPWQGQMTEHLLAHKRCALWADIGMGKTSTTLMALAGRKLAGMGGKALILAPLRVARDVWPDEQKRWEQLEDFTVQPIIGSAVERCAALRNDKADAYTMNYENLPWLVDKIGVDAWPFETIVPDEARRLKGHRLAQGGARTEALAKVMHDKVKYVMELTGRPAPNGLKDLWGQMWFLDKGFRLGHSFDAFEKRWFAFQSVKDAINPNKHHVQTVIFPHSDAEIHALIADLCLTVDPKDWFDVADPVERRIEVALPPAARKAYREMEREYFTQIEGHEIEAFAAAAKSIKCLSLASGAAYIDGQTKDWVITHDEKIQALQSIIEEANGASVLVAYHFRSTLARLLKAIPKSVDLATKVGMAAFKAGDATVGIGSPQSVGHGTDGLQNVCNICVFVDHWWDMDCRDQFIGRIGPTRQKQAGLDRPVFVYDITSKGTLDEDVLERHASKRSVQDILLEAMKRRKTE